MLKPINSTNEELVVAIIPVRGGSKGVTDKNLRLVAGRPLLWYAIEAARRAGQVGRAIVSTESPELADVARANGAEVVLHPPELSGENSPTYPVIRWNLRRMRERQESPLLVVVLRATSPLRTAKDVDAAIELLLSHPEADSVVSVAPAVGIHPIRLKRVCEDGRLVDAFEPEGRSPRRRQELEPLYLRNGAVYVSRPPVIEAGGLWGDHCLAYVMPEERSININTEHQLRVADLLLTHGVNRTGNPGERTL